jgi:hypothetical protein
LFESVTRIPARFWMNKQRSYDEYLARKRQLALIDEEMNKNGNETIKHESQQVL